MKETTDHSLQRVFEYHERTKHHLDRYARSLGYLDWANQPDPFRCYEGAPKVSLEHPDDEDSPRYEEIFGADLAQVEQFDGDFISQFFYDSLAISAWKQAPGTPSWALRVNPSSGNLHPTESYLICGALPGISANPGIYHYSPFEHALEKRVSLTQQEWQTFSGCSSSSAIFLLLTSIYWREAWKYGERAFRYCNHDLGHALGAVSLAAAALGARSRLIQGIAEDELSDLLSLKDQKPDEIEQPECLLEISQTPDQKNIQIPPDLLQRLSARNYLGEPNQLSDHHHPWPLIDDVSEATKYSTDQSTPAPSVVQTSSGIGKNLFLSSSYTARQLFRRRRSAVAMDPSASISRPVFFGILSRLSLDPDEVPFSILPWRPQVSLLFFVHRVRDLKKGIYILVRNPKHLNSLRRSFRPEFLWQEPEGCPAELDLYRLAEGDCRDSARVISCHQTIAADGVFSLGMLARFEPILRTCGPWFYRRLHWECGLVGQLLYIEAEAAGISGTGIGCFHDDLVHQLLGLKDRTWQTLYHFTVGRSLDDFRLQTVPAYHHLSRS